MIANAKPAGPSNALYPSIIPLKKGIEHNPVEEHQLFHTVSFLNLLDL